MEKVAGYLKPRQLSENVYEDLAPQNDSRDCLTQEDNDAVFERIYDEVARENFNNDDAVESSQTDGYMQMNHFKLNQRSNEYENTKIQNSPKVIYMELSPLSSGGDQTYLNMNGIRKTNYTDIKFN